MTYDIKTLTTYRMALKMLELGLSIEKVAKIVDISLDELAKYLSEQTQNDRFLVLGY